MRAETPESKALLGTHTQVPRGSELQKQALRKGSGNCRRMHKGGSSLPLKDCASSFLKAVADAERSWVRDFAGFSLRKHGFGALLRSSSFRLQLVTICHLERMRIQR